MSKARDIADLGSNDVLETTATGLDVTGIVTADGLTVDTGSPFSFTGTFGNGDANKLVFINDDGAGRNQIDSTSSGGAKKLDLATGGLKRVRLDDNGDVSFYEDTGTTAKMVWDASAENLELTGGWISSSGWQSNGSVYETASSIYNGLYGVAQHEIAIATFGSERMRIDSAGNVGIGTASPSANLSIKGSTGFTGLDIADGSDRTIMQYFTTDGFRIANITAKPIIFKTSDIERARIDSSGNLLVGTTTSPTGSGGVSVSNKLTVGYQGVLNGYGGENYSGLYYSGGNNSAYTAINSNSGNGCLYLSRTSSAPNGLMLHFASNGTSVGSINTVAGYLVIGSGNTGLIFDTSAANAIYPQSVGGANQDGTTDLGYTGSRFKDLHLSGASNAPDNRSSGIQYFTHGTDARFRTTTGSERMRLDSSGNLLVGTTGGGFASKMTVENTVSYTFLSRRTGTGSEGHLVFQNANGAVGTIFTNGSTTNYNTSSDERLKENIKDTTHTVDINDIQVREFDWKVDGSHQRYGFIAQELETVYPEAVHSPEDTDEMMSVDYSKLVPLLVKEIQQLKTRIETLENN